MEKKPEKIDKDLISVLIKKNKYDKNVKEVLNSLLLDDKYMRVFKQRISYIKTCQTIIDMEISIDTNCKKRELLNYYNKIFKSFFGYYQLLMRNNNSNLALEIYLDVCDLKQCKNDLEYYKLLEFLFSIYTKFDDLKEYKTVVKLVDINNQYFDLLNKYVNETSLENKEFIDNVTLFVANNNSDYINEEQYEENLKKYFKNNDKKNYYIA